MITPPNQKVTIRQVNVALLWHQNLMSPEALASPDVLDLDTYQRLFNTKRKDQTGPLTVPWPPHERQGFWERYLGCPLPSVVARDARRALVPLRAAAPLTVTAAADTRVRTEGILHPWGATFLAVLEVTGEWPSLEAAAERVVAVRRGSNFRLAGQPEEMGLEQVAERGLEAVRSLAAQSFPGPKTDPFAISALVQGEGEMAAFDPGEEETGALRFLQAVSSFSPTWKSDTLRPLTEAKVAGKTEAPPFHLVFGSRRGRAIWSPVNFLKDPQAATSTLTCQYRNLVFATLQTEALARFAENTARRLAQGTALSDEHRTQVRWAVQALQKAFAGIGTYRSGALKSQLQQNQLLPAINAVGADQGLPPIGP